MLKVHACLVGQRLGDCPTTSDPRQDLTCPTRLGGVLQYWWPFSRHAYALHYDIEVDLRKYTSRYKVIRQVRLAP